MRKTIHGLYCAAFGCRNKQCDKEGKSFFTIPNNPERATLWLNAVNRNDLVNSLSKGKITHRICSDHFQESDFLFRRLLKQQAVPSLEPAKVVPSLEPAKVDVPKDVSTSKLTLVIQNGCFTLTPSTLSVNSPRKRNIYDQSVTSSKKIQWNMANPASATTTSNNQVQSGASQVDEYAICTTELSCLACGVELPEKIYKCVECEDVTMCGECERDNFHPHHCVLRVPSRTIYNALRSVLASLQRELSEKLSVKGDEDEDPFQLGSAAAADDDEDSECCGFESNETWSRQSDGDMETNGDVEFEVPIITPKAKGKHATKANGSKLTSTNTGESRLKPSNTKNIKGKVDKRPTSDTTASARAHKKYALDTLEGKRKEFKISSELSANAPLGPYERTCDTGDPLFIKEEIKQEPVDEAIERIQYPDGDPGPSTFSVVGWHGTHKSIGKPH